MQTLSTNQVSEEELRLAQQYNSPFR